MDTQRLILLFIFGFSALMLWESWQKETRPKPAPSAAVAQQSVPATPSESPRPGKPAATAPAELPASVPGGQANATKGQTLRVNTDLFVAEIDTLGGTLKRIELLRHKDARDPTKNFVLLGPEHHYEAQSGLTGERPNHLSLWRAQGTEYALALASKPSRCG